MLSHNLRGVVHCVSEILNCQAEGDKVLYMWRQTALLRNARSYVKNILRKIHSLVGLSFCASCLCWM